MDKYYISASGQQYWQPTPSTTLRGAMCTASRRYQTAVGGKIKIAERIDHTSNPDGSGVEYVEVAVKYGYGRWQIAGQGK